MTQDYLPSLLRGLFISRQVAPGAKELGLSLQVRDIPWLDWKYTLKVKVNTFRALTFPDYLTKQISSLILGSLYRQPIIMNHLHDLWTSVSFLPMICCTFRILYHFAIIPTYACEHSYAPGRGWCRVRPSAYQPCEGACQYLTHRAYKCYRLKTGPEDQAAPWGPGVNEHWSRWCCIV